MKFSYSLIALSFIFTLSIAGCNSTLKVAALECDTLPTQNEISKCKSEKQKGGAFSSQQHIKEAQKKLLQGDKYESLDLLNKAIKEFPDGAEAHFNKGIVLASVGENNLALETFDRSLELDPKYSIVHYYKGNLLIEEHRYKEAIEAFNKAVQTNPDMAIAYYKLGDLYKDAQERDKSISSYYQAYQIWKAKLDGNPGYFVQDVKMQKTYYQVRRYLRGVGVLNAKDYRITPVHTKDTIAPEESDTTAKNPPVSATTQNPQQIKKQDSVPDAYVKIQNATEKLLETDEE